MSTIKLHANEQQFLESEWLRRAERPEAEARVRSDYQRWVSRVGNSQLVSRAGKLWGLLTSGKIAGKEKLAVLAALLYLICPLDLVPDYIPVVGWLDDLGIAACVLAYVLRKADDFPAGATSRETSDQCTLQIDAASLPDSGVLASDQEDLRFLRDLKRVCALLRAEALLPAVEEIELRCQRPLFRVMFVGRYNTGKSTLINRLLGADYLAVGPLPTTKAITFMLPATKPQVFVEGSDGTIQAHKDIGILQDKSHPALLEAARVSLMLPSEILRRSICFIDTPGLEDPDLDTTALLREYVSEADALVFVLDTSYTLGDPERQFIQRLLADDRHRKLFFVANKIDKIAPAELPMALDSIRQELEALDVTPQIYPLVADCHRDQGTTVGFRQFRESLLMFLDEGRTAEQKRIIRREIGNLTNQLEEVSAAQRQFAAAEETERRRRVRELQEQQYAAQETVQRAQAELTKRIAILQSGLLADIDEFSADLATVTCRRIDEASLEELRKTDVLERSIRELTKSFLEPRLTRIREQLGELTSDTIRQMTNDLRRLPFSIEVLRSRSLLEESPQIVTAGILVVAFPFLSLFSFLYVLVGVLLGRNVLEDLVRNLMGRCALNKLRAELKSAVRSQLEEYARQLTERLNVQFREVEAVLKGQLSTVADQVLAPVTAVLETGTGGTSPTVAPAQLSEALSILHTVRHESQQGSQGGGDV